MKIHSVCAVMALAVCSAASASTVHNLQGVPYSVDTLAHYAVGPASTFTQLKYRSQANSVKHFTASVLEFDLTKAADAGLDFRMHLGRDSVHTSETMSTVALRHTNADNHYFAAINGDFFITWSWTPGMLGFPNNTACSNGQMALSDNVDNFNHVDAWVMDRNFGMWCDQTVLSNKLILADNSTSFNLYGINFRRRDDARLDNEDDSADIVFYNEHRGKYTGSPAGWKEIPVVLDEGATWRINQPVQLRIAGAMSETGHMAIPRNGGVIACGPNAPLDLASFSRGDLITLSLGLTLPTFGNLAPDVKEVCGGDVTLLRNGQAVFEANRFINARDSEYPRTMVGYDLNRTKMVWVTVDGKTNANTGCSYPQGADMMKALGCYDAINFDGGGSTAMWTDHNGIVNTPSDGSERAVGNGLFAVLQRPTDNVITSIAFRDWSLTSPQFGIYTPVIYGYNQYGQLIDTNVQGYTLTCAPELGEITADGASAVLSGSGLHALTATLGGASASIAVTIVPTEALSFNVENMIVDNFTPRAIKAFSLVGSELMELAPMALTWTSDNPFVATVDELGCVTGISDGIATITASVGELSGQVRVSVECPIATEADLESPITLDHWQISGYNIKSSSLAPYGDCGFEINYNITINRNPRLALETVTPMQIWSLPSAIIVDLTPQGTPVVNNAVLNVTPANDKMKKIKIEPISHGQNNHLVFDLSEIVDLDDPATWPMCFNNLTLYLNGTGDGTIRIDSVKALYPSFSGLELHEAVSDANAPVEYFNLQGIRIANPGNGLYIRRQGSRSTKIFINQ